jgi:hypothetical protein
MKRHFMVYALVLLASAGTAQAASVSARLQQVEDHIAIERVLMEYGRALDSRDFTKYSQLFAKEGEWSGSLGTFRGPAAIKTAMEEAFKNSKAAPIPTNFHLLTNAIIDLQGDRATAWSKWTFMRVAGGKPIVALAGQYEDTLVREDGQWKFLRRTAQTPTSPATAQDTATPHLSTQDYIDIQQLVSDYSFHIDECSNAGYDYADLYTPDGEFAVSDRWGGGGKRTFVTTGREALARVAGGREGKCIDPKSSPGYGISHVTVNLVITPTADGATGKSYLLAIGVGGDPTSVERQGGYEDVYVKTAAGWRIKTRTHVWPNMADSVMFKKFSKQLTSPTSGAQEQKR